MNNEFKKIKQQNNITRYVLETATAGAISAAMVPTMDRSVGEVQARVPQKPRQGPLKPQTGGGAHRDKKKEQKSGQEKHRKPFAEHGVAESDVGSQIKGALAGFGAGVKDASLEKAIVYFLQGRHQEGQQFLSGALRGVSAEVTKKIIDQLQKLPKSKVDPNTDTNAQKYIKDTVMPWIKQQLSASSQPSNQNQSSPQNTGYKTGLSDDNAAKQIAQKIQGMPVTQQNVQQYVKKYLDMVGRTEKDLPQLSALVLDLLQDKELAEGFEEPDHEISMASNELKSIINDAKKLLMIVQRISEMEGLEAWQQSKITKATDYISSVLRTLQGENSVVEANNNLEWKKYDHESEFIKQLPREYQDPIDSADGTKAEFYDNNDQQIGIFVRADFRDYDGPGTGAYWGPKANMAEGFADIAADSFEIGEKVEYDRSIWTIIDKDPVEDTLTIARDIETVDALKVGKVRKDLEEKMQGTNEGEKKGLYYYVNKRKKAGTSRPKGHPKAPSEQDWENAAKTAKKESKEVYLDTLFEKLQNKLK